ncbi:ribbon-helix-helix protein, CopG family [Microbacterium suaedae]|uniref:ribbon-helix-helix protein, CopG family n=1 Tax=Microbacterium suaedae TaxID=2067813 RepID=UPI000DA16EC9|nr:ribbon-helix-helix protein, CopG family [Microbacterium suaedae]
MAMTLRLPPELDSALDAIAAAEHMSKHALVLSGIEELVRQRLQRARLRADFERLRDEEAEVLRRLEDA